MYSDQGAGKLPRQWSEPEGPRVGQEYEPEGPQGPKGECEGSELASVYYMFFSIQGKIAIFR